MLGARKKKPNQNPGVTDVDKAAYASALGVDVAEEGELLDFVSRALDHPLPEPWVNHANIQGQVFYFNTHTRESTWKHPLINTHKTLVDSYRRIAVARDRDAAIDAELKAFQRQGEEEISHWLEARTDDGTPYYYKIETGTTRWDSPHDELLHHMKLRVRMLTDLRPTTPPEQFSPRTPPPEPEPLSPAHTVEKHGDLARARLASGGVCSWPVHDVRGRTETPRGGKDAGVWDPSGKDPKVRGALQPASSAATYTSETAAVALAGPSSPKPSGARFSPGFGQFGSGLGRLGAPKRDVSVEWAVPPDEDS